MSATGLYACLLLGIGSVLSASAQTVVTKTTWSDLSKWPDFTTGNWGNAFGAPQAPATAAGASAGAPPIPRSETLTASLTSKYAAKVAAVMKLRGPGGSGAASCEPEGVVADTGSKFYFDKDVIIIGGATDRSNVWRRVYMNRTVHGDPEPTYFGDSIGHWEGDTLVIDTTAIRAEAQLITGVPVESTQTHLVERYRLINHDTLELQKTVENPEIFTKPWVTTKTLKRTVGDEFPEAICWRDREEHSATTAPDMTR